MMRRLNRFFLLPAVLLFAIAGCGYHFSGDGPGPKPGLKTIAVPVFENTTSEPELGAKFAGALRREFLQKGSLKVVPVEEAEAIFRGRITEIRTTGVGHRHFKRRFEDRLTLESRIYVTLDLRCVDAQNGAVLWQDPNFTYYQVYRQQSLDPQAPAPQNIVSFENRQAALEFLAKEMAIRIHDRFLSNF